MTALNTLTEEEKSAGFRLLFDGVSTELWRGYGVPHVPDTWNVAEGEIRLKPGPKAGIDIMTIEQFDSFELYLEWKLGPAGNSGIMYHVRDDLGDSDPYMTGPEIQVLDNSAYMHLKGGALHHSGACYALYAPSHDVTKPLGEWNSVRIVVNGDHVTHDMNGQRIVEYVLGSDDWNAKVANAKFKDWPNFARHRRGHICLQDHAHAVAYRNIKIRPITTP